jgi:protein-L-isoaspartate(D-aspartate) O-methyltransferase
MKKRLGDKLAEEEFLRNPRLIDSFNRIDRADFVPAPLRDQAYEDYPLPIGFESTISQPSVVAFMLELLEPQKNEKILDLGSGSGWTTALLADLAGPKGFVVGVELIPELVEIGRKNLERYPSLPATIQPAGKILGSPNDAPFDRILVSAAAEEAEAELLKQLKIGGSIVIPIAGSIFFIKKVADEDFESTEYPGYVFVPLIKKD